MGVHRGLAARATASLALALLAAACTGSPAAPAGSAAPATAEAGDSKDAGAKPSSSASTCDDLRAQFEAGDRKLARECETKEDCTMLWSDYNCYALRGPDDDVSRLVSIDEAMRKQGCAEVECEPPPLIKCAGGICGWDL